MSLNFADVSFIFPKSRIIDNRCNITKTPSYLIIPQKITEIVEVASHKPFNVKREISGEWERRTVYTKLISPTLPKDRAKPVKCPNPEKRLDNLIRARNTMIDLMRANITKDASFVLFTYADVKDLTPEIIKSHWERFIEDLRKKTGQLIPYMLTIERGKRFTKRLHFHVSFFENTFTQKILEETWKHGWVKPPRHLFSSGAGDYVAKYISKDASLHQAFKKCYLCSKGLKRKRVERYFSPFFFEETKLRISSIIYDEKFPIPSDRKNLKLKVNHFEWIDSFTLEFWKNPQKNENLKLCI